MELLLWFQGISNDALDIIFKILTLIGEQYFVMVIFCYLAWCGDKIFAHKTGFAFCMGLGINQVLKLIFCVQRPWVLDSRITASPYAIESATGYSFPSGHTQSGVTVFGCLAKRFGGVAFKIACVLCALGVGVSRLYFRVHTPWDVAVSFVIGILVIFATEKVYDFCVKHDLATLVAGFVISLLMVVYAVTKSYPEYHIAEYAYDCIKIAGAVGGFITGWCIERRYIKYKSFGGTVFNVVKTLVGIILLLVIKIATKTLPETYAMMYIENFILIFWCVALYPFILTKIKPSL
ncbi:MAG: phosphatase PAP2 family protein [Clostridia bacterium]|nr:phosphatase PAP2 family protein [Clostridia bacterium]